MLLDAASKLSEQNFLMPDWASEDFGSYFLQQKEFQHRAQRLALLIALNKDTDHQKCEAALSYDDSNKHVLGTMMLQKNYVINYCHHLLMIMCMLQC